MATRLTPLTTVTPTTSGAPVLSQDTLLHRLEQQAGRELSSIVTTRLRSLANINFRQAGVEPTDEQLETEMMYILIAALDTERVTGFSEILLEEA